LRSIAESLHSFSWLPFWGGLSQGFVDRILAGSS